MGQRPDEMSRYELGETGSETDPAEIRAEIEETRAEMTGTIDAIQERLSPSYLKEQVKEQVREQFQEAKSAVRDATLGKVEDMARTANETFTEARYGLMETIRQNPLPAAIAGIGLGWLWINRQSGSPRRYSRSADMGYYREGQTYYPNQRGYVGGASYSGTAERNQVGVGQTLHRAQDAAGHTLNRAQEAVGDFADRAQETVGDFADRAQDTVSDLAGRAQETVGSAVDQTRETAGYLADQAQEQAQRLEDRFQRLLHENPLAVGAVALAVGTAVGFALPQTERENQLMGEARDNLVERTAEVAQETFEKARQVAGDVVEQAQTTAQQSAEKQGLAR